MPAALHETQIDPSTEQAGPRDVVVYVHGTWGRGFLFRRAQPRWCDSDAPLSIALSRAFPFPPCFFALSWSGRNNLAARAQAADKLQKLIESIRQQHGNCRIHIVAHSHGGNVACYALRNPDARRAVASLTCLSTPFLLITARPCAGKISALLRGGIAFLVFVSLFFAIVEAYVALLQENAPGEIVALASGVLAFCFAKWLAHSQRIRTEKIARAFELPGNAATACPTLIIRAPSDEASMALSAVQLAGNILTSLAKGLGFLVPSWPRRTSGERRSSRKFWVRLLLAAVLPVAAFSTSLYESLLAAIWMSDSSGDFLLRLVVGTAVLMATSYLIPVVLMMAAIGVVALAMGLLLVPFGPGLAFHGWSLHVSAEASPPGEWSVIQLEAPDDEQMRHATHSNPAAVALLGKWLQDSFRRGRSSS